MKFNADKCCGMSFTAKVNSLCNTKYYIVRQKARHELTKVDYFSDLRVKFNFKLCFLDHVNDNISKAYSVLGVIKRNFIYTYMEKTTFSLLYKAMVKPH